jgi:hypothetical protein
MCNFVTAHECISPVASLIMLKLELVPERRTNSGGITFLPPYFISASASKIIHAQLGAELVLQATSRDF